MPNSSSARPLRSQRRLHDAHLLEEARRHRPDVAVLVLSRAPTVQHATETIRRGAEDFLPVPYAEEILRKEVVRILEAAELRDHVEHLRQLVTQTFGFDRIVSRSSRMRPVFDRALAASRSDTPVLIFGETGTGKELFARAIHANGLRSSVAPPCSVLAGPMRPAAITVLASRAV